MHQPTTVDDERLLHRALCQLRDATELPLTFGGAVHTGQRVRLTEFSGAHAGALRGVVLNYGCGLGGKVVRLRRPMVVNDYVTTSGISHHYDHFITAEGLRAMVAVPVIVHRTVRGVLYGSLRAALPLGDRVISSTLDSARELEQELAVSDELNRRFANLELRAANPPSTQDVTQWELVREAYAELRILATTTGDVTIRDRMDAICRKLVRLHDPDTALSALPTLSTREVDVLACVALGWTNAQVAADLGITTETVKSYLRSAMHKLAAHSRLEAVVTARRHGILP